MRKGGQIMKSAFVENFDGLIYDLYVNWWNLGELLKYFRQNQKYKVYEWLNCVILENWKYFELKNLLSINLLKLRQLISKDQIFGTLKYDSTQFHSLGWLNPWKKMIKKWKMDETLLSWLNCVESD